MPDVLKHPSKYRIDPIVIKPFETQKECLDEIVRHHPAGWLKEKDTSNIYSIQAVFADSLHIKDIVWDFQACSQFFIFLDGNAFGKIDNTNK